MRKVLSFVLVLSLVLGSFSMAFAADTSAGLSDVSGIANEDAIQVAYDLNIVTGNPDGTFQPEKAVNRAEFAAMITRALAIPDSALAGYTTTSFKDTTGYGWAVPYLAFCQSKGIMLGDGYGNAMPGRTISVNEAMTMALRAIGYTANSSLLVGAWPANYVSLAQNSDLYDDVAAVTTVDKANAAQIIYNLLTVQKVAVNSDGTTDYLWDGKASLGIEANLLNTNLGCDEVADEILGDNYGYDEALINITDKIGAFGTAYVNSDDELVAFTVKSTALTGKVDGAKFKVGDTKYDIESTITKSAIFDNADKQAGYAGIITAPAISAAAVNTDDGKTVTINVDLSGKKIKEVYSVVAWDADQFALAESDVQEDIADGALLNEDFVLDDDDNIDLTSFQLVGVASLDKIAEDDVVYVYTDGSDIRKVAVGTETVEGVVEETDDVNMTVTIDGKDYDIAAISALTIPGDVDVDSEGIFYLDVNGEIFDFEGTTGSADTYGVVKAVGNETGFDNAKFSLYMSDDSSKTLYFADDVADIDWVTSPAGFNTTFSGITTGALIGYGLDSEGDIDTVDLTANRYDNTSGTTSYQSTKVMSVGGASKSIDSNAVVFTYDTTISAISKYDVAGISEVKKGSIVSSTQPAFIILNDDGKVAAMFIEKSFVDADDDDVYGVLNTRTNAKSGDDTVYKLTGFIDGTAFSKMTDKRTSSYEKEGLFGVYKITVDANDVITGVAPLSSAPAVDNASGIIAAAAVIDSLNSDRTVITAVGGAKYTVADDAVVYLYDEADDEFSVSKLSALRKDYTVSLYDTKGTDADGIASVVIYFED
ncbi:MAG: S-layer homology domain-containing protein [Eubacteriales bacterium]|nr:S-layer homology domain-containing protein [Eubacteriales bacterium]